MTAEFIRERITQLRLKKGISEYRMSYDLGHSRGYINNISSGKSLPSMMEFLAICDYLGITPVDFFTPEILDPAHLNEIVGDLKKLNDKDLNIVHDLIKRLK